MKTYKRNFNSKHIWYNDKGFNYETINGKLFHGLLNYNNICIGYKYKEERKGFWLSEFKKK